MAPVTTKQASKLTSRECDIKPASDLTFDPKGGAVVKIPAPPVKPLYSYIDSWSPDDQKFYEIAMNALFEGWMAGWDRKRYADPKRWNTVPTHCYAQDEVDSWRAAMAVCDFKEERAKVNGPRWDEASELYLEELEWFWGKIGEEEAGKLAKVWEDLKGWRMVWKDLEVEETIQEGLEDRKMNRV